MVVVCQEMLANAIKRCGRLIGIINISIGLQKLITDSNWAALPSNRKERTERLMNWLYRFMYGRYGADQLTFALIILS